MTFAAMNPERWRKISQLYHLALQQEPAQQNGFLAKACQDDSELRAEVESLLAQSGGSELLVDRMAWVEAEDLVATGTILTPGARLGPYRILGPLGEGGMGQGLPRPGHAPGPRRGHQNLSRAVHQTIRARGAGDLGAEPSAHLHPL